MVKENRKFRFNIIDLIIVLFMILAVIGIIIRYDIADDINFNASGETFEIEFYVSDIRAGSEEFLQAGETFYITIDSIELGTVLRLTDVREAIVYLETSEGDIVQSFAPGRVDVTGIMRSTGRTTREGNIMLNGQSFVAPGAHFFVHTGKRECWITIMSIERVD
jgi:hypothetical protein